ncbi:hypothetical protein ACVVIH_07350 [Chryseobacterium arthrosphaerae]|uniref:hypothetical protein n=1 Tax=Chryseobacterium arthrosphaerae TaxID=651561 RepID=UPI003D337CD5
MKRGEIYRLKKEFKKNYHKKSFNHSFVFWENSGIDINGIMITCSDNPIYANKRFEENHFEPGHEIGYGKSADYPESYFVPAFLLKKVKFEQLDFVGRLTQDGIDYIEKLRSELEYTDWETHMLEIKKRSGKP